MIIHPQDYVAYGHGGRILPGKVVVCHLCTFKICSVTKVNVILAVVRVVSRFLSRRFRPKSRRLFPFYFSNITLRTDLLTFGVTGAVFKIAGEMRRLWAYFDNPGLYDQPKRLKKNLKNSSLTGNRTLTFATPDATLCQAN